MIKIFLIAFLSRTIQIKIFVITKREGQSGELKNIF